MIEKLYMEQSIILNVTSRKFIFSSFTRKMLEIYSIFALNCMQGLEKGFSKLSLLKHIPFAC